jgi:beta-galactosidase
MGPWKDAGSLAKAESLTVESDPDGRALVRGVVRIAKPDARIEVAHVVAADGSIDSRFRFTAAAKSPELPRIGIQFEIPERLRAIEWFGRGPHENYWDRKSSAFIGHHRATVDDWITPYVRPQENANRCDVRWISFTDGDGSGLRASASADRPLSVSAWPYTMADLTGASHDFKLPRRESITVNLDHLQMGVGGDNSWGLPVNKPYRIQAGTPRDWTLRMQSLQTTR